jgi:predicted urease superfamily metal-dependent hydrolase
MNKGIIQDNHRHLLNGAGELLKGVKRTGDVGGRGFEVKLVGK